MCFAPSPRTATFAGQFERFRKELRSGDFAPLIKHQTYTVLSQLSLADAMVAIRVMVCIIFASALSGGFDSNVQAAFAV